MKLKSVQVVLFRNVLDSSTVQIDGDITCLVGKNESGKTSFLQALHALNPSVEKPLNLMDYPAWLRKSHELRGKALESETPIRATFGLDEVEQAALVERFGIALQSAESVAVARQYGGAVVVDSPLDDAAWVRAFIDEHCGDLPVGEAPGTVRELASALDALVSAAPEDDGEDVRPQAEEARAALDARFGGSLDPETSLREWVEQRLPEFLYVGRYHTLPGVIEIQRIAGAFYEQLDEDDQIAKALLELSSADVQIATGTDYERRVRELNDTANALTLEILDYWSQNQDIRVEIDFDQESQGNNRSIVKNLHVRLYDSEHMISLPFGERSSGFQWFFSFLCAFSRYRRSGDPVILLLDEPALGLHARAQRDFLRYIEEQLAGVCQVIYTTHSPFMVQPKHLQRVRLVEDRGRKKGAKVTSDALSSDPDTVFPLQGALGYDLAQNLFVGPYNLIVEGTSDFTYLQLISDHLRANSMVGLDERCTIVPVGGAGQIATFAALLGSRVDATVLIDSAKQGNQRLQRLVEQGVLKKSRVIGIGEITGTTEADVEDMFEIDEYLDLFNQAFSKSYSVSDLTGSDPIVRRLARAEGVDRFDHGRPAEVLLRQREGALTKLSDTTKQRFVRLFERINATLPE